MNKNNFLKESLIIVPFSVPWNWTTDYNNQTVEILRRHNFVICLFRSDLLSLKEAIQKKIKFRIIYKIKKNVIGFNYVELIPFKRFSLIRKLNDYLCVVILTCYILLLSFKNRYKNIFIWFFDTYWYQTFIFLNRFYYSIYDCVDYYLDLTFLPENKKEQRIREEINMIKKVDLFVVNSYQLFDLYKEIRSDLKIVPQGFRLDIFKKFNNFERKMNNTNKKIIGFVGGINNRLDYDLLIKLVFRNPEINFVFWGPIQELTKENSKKKEKLFSAPNVKSGKSINKNEIPKIISEFDLGMIPYNIKQDFNRFCYPMKLFEYFYLGKPVISTPIEELKRFPKFVKIGNTVNLWEKHIKQLLSKKMTISNKKMMQNLAVDNSWEKKLSAICSILKKKTKRG